MEPTLNKTIDSEEITLIDDSELNDNELTLIFECVNAVGELYSFLGIPYDSTFEEIDEAYYEACKKIKNQEVSLGVDISPNDKIMLEDLSRDLKSTYYILSDPRFRNSYNTSFFENLVSDTQSETFNKSISIIFDLAIRLINIPLEQIQHNIIPRPGLESTFSVIKSMYRENGLLSFYKGSPLILVGLPFKIILDGLIDLVTNRTLLKESVNVSIIRSILNPIFLYPIKLLRTCISVAPLSTLEILKKIISREKFNGDSGRNQLEIKHLFYAFSSDILLHFLTEFIRKSAQDLEQIFYLKKRDHPNSKIWEYGSILLNNPITQGLLLASILWPIKVISLQYPIGLVQSCLTNTPIPYVINPISMAIKVYQEQGLRKFFNGALTTGIPYYTTC